MFIARSGRGCSNPPTKNVYALNCGRPRSPMPGRCRYRLSYKGTRLDCGYRLDVVVDNALILEIKAVEQLLPIHEAQILTYLRLSRHKVGLIINFNTALLKNGVRRFVL
jgi:GxxExxY protein